MTIEVRQLREEDLDDFMKVAETFFYESYNRDSTIDLDKFRSLIVNSINNPTVAIPTVFVDGALAGYIIICYTSDFKKEREGDMYELYVHPSYRGTGASRALAEATVKQFDEWGCVHSHLSAAPGLPDQEHTLAVFRNLWAKYGYQQTGIILTREKR